MKVIILRGLPGAGKSRYAKEQTNYAQAAGLIVKIVSADDYHMRAGRYIFNPINQSLAHNGCLKEALVNMQVVGKCDLLIIDNTNIAAWEIAPYYRLAEIFAHKVEIHRLNCDYETACRRNVHEVPTGVIWSMYQRLFKEELPPWWKEKVLFGDPI